MSNVPEAKSLRWLAIQFPYTKDPKDDTDRLSNAIHLYATAGADCIDRLQAEVDSLRDEAGSGDKFLIYIPCYDSDPLTNRGDYNKYLCSVHLYCSGPSFGFSDDIDEACEFDHDFACTILHWLQEDHPSAVIVEVPGNE